MNKPELINLIETRHDELIEALREADRAAWCNRTCKYSVALFPDGHTELRERLAGDNWYYHDDPAVMEIDSFCHQYCDPLRDGLASDELLYLMESEMDEIERTEYKRYREDFFGTEDEEPDDWNCVNWIEEDLPDLWQRVRDRAIEELTSDEEADATYEASLAYAVRMYIEYQTD